MTGPAGGMVAAVAIAAVLLVGSAPRLEHVRRTIDGDTVMLESGERIRFRAIDAPETHPCRCPEECRLGAAATDAVREMVRGGIRVERTGRDRYGRTLANVFGRDGEDIQSILVARGLARRWTGRREPWC